MKKLVSYDVVEVEYDWCHNHADSAQAKSKLPLGRRQKSLVVRTGRQSDLNCALARNPLIWYVLTPLNVS
jgi:hypothetical protein